MTKRGKREGHIPRSNGINVISNLRQQRAEPSIYSQSSEGKGRYLPLNVALVKPLIPELGGTKQEDRQLEASPSYIMNSRPASAIDQDPVSPPPQKKTFYWQPDACHSGGGHGEIIKS